MTATVAGCYKIAEEREPRARDGQDYPAYFQELQALLWAIVNEMKGKEKKKKTKIPRSTWKKKNAIDYTIHEESGEQLDCFSFSHL